MAMNNTMQTVKKSPVNMMKDIVNNAGSMQILKNSLNDNAGAFAASVIDLYNSDTTLQKCDPAKVFGECLKAVSLKLPINKQLGFAYIIPYGNVPQFQLGYKGLVQLAMRTGAYRFINAGAVYEGEYVKSDKQTGAIDLNGARTGDDIIGYFAYIETMNGFSKTLYWTVDELKAHALRYSKSYKNGNAIWKDNFKEMATKTVLRNLLTHWGFMSVDMASALSSDADETLQPEQPSAKNTVNVPEADIQVYDDSVPEITADGVDDPLA